MNKKDLLKGEIVVQAFPHAGDIQMRRGYECNLYVNGGTYRSTLKSRYTLKSGQVRYRFESVLIDDHEEMKNSNIKDKPPSRIDIEIESSNGISVI